MSVKLSLHSGTGYAEYWNPNVWTINPNGDKNVPTPNQNNSCWVKVLNSGTETTQATVQWFAPPYNASNTTWGPITACPAGFATSSVAAGQTIEMESETPWVPTQTGKVCLVAVVWSLYDPAPEMGQMDPVNIADRHVAQFNLTVVSLLAGTKSAAHNFQVFAHTAERQIAARRVPMSQLTPYLDSVNLKSLPVEIGGKIDFHLERAATFSQGKSAAQAKKKLRRSMTLARDKEHSLVLVVKPPSKAQLGSGAFFQIETTENGRLAGGLGALFLIKNK